MTTDLDAAVTEAQRAIDYPYVACCADCGTRLYCAHDTDDTGHDVHGRAQRDVHDLARQVLSLAAALRTERAAREAAEAEAESLAADVAAAVDAAARSTREACAAQLRARAECLRRYAYEATAKADAAEYAHDAREVDACAAIVASVAIAAPTGGRE